MKSKFGVAALVAALAVIAGAEAATAEQFNLACKGASEKSRSTLRIDLSANEWCAGDCKQINRIQEVTSGRLLLMEVRPQRPNDLQRIEEVNRITGEYRSLYKDGGVEFWRTSQSCQLEPFSGFPLAERKF